MTDRVTDAIVLAKNRWAQWHCFDIDDDTWLRLFTDYYAGDVLQSIRLTRYIRSTDQGEVYRRFEHAIAKLAAQRSTTN